MTPKSDVPDRAVEAAQEALTKKYGKVVATSLNDIAIIVLEAAAPHIIKQHEATRLSPEQFIDGLPTVWCKKVVFQAYLAYQDAPEGDRLFAEDNCAAEFRRQLKRLIPTPEGKKDDR